MSINAKRESFRTVREILCGACVDLTALKSSEEPDTDIHPWQLVRRIKFKLRSALWSERNHAILQVDFFFFFFSSGVRGFKV